MTRGSGRKGNPMLGPGQVSCTSRPAHRSHRQPPIPFQAFFGPRCLSTTHKLPEHGTHPPQCPASGHSLTDP